MTERAQTRTGTRHRTDSRVRPSDVANEPGNVFKSFFAEFQIRIFWLHHLKCDIFDILSKHQSVTWCQNWCLEFKFIPIYRLWNVKKIQFQRLRFKERKNSIMHKLQQQLAGVQSTLHCSFKMQCRFVFILWLKIY